MLSGERFFGKALRCQCISRPQVAENLQLKIQKDNRSSTNVLASNGCELGLLILLQDRVSDHFFFVISDFHQLNPLCRGFPRLSGLKTFAITVMPADGANSAKTIRFFFYSPFDFAFKVSLFLYRLTMF